AAVWRIMRENGVTIQWRLPVDWRHSYLLYALKSYLAMIAQSMNYRLDSLIVNALLGSAAVGVYSTAVAASEFLLFLPNASAIVLYPRIASLPSKDATRTTVFTLGVSFYLVLGGGLALSLVVPWLIPHLYGRAFSSAASPTRWLIPGMLGLTILKTLSSAVAGLGRPEYMTYSIL